MSAFVPTLPTCGVRTAGVHAVTSTVTRKPKYQVKSSSFLSGGLKYADCTIQQDSRADNRSRQVVKSTLTTERLANKSYQLEEDEDESSCTTAMFFNEDGTISMGRTDGPTPDRVKATWKYNDSDEEILLEIERYFEGEAGIEFMVKRILRGHLDSTRNNRGDLPVFTGAMYPFPTDFSKHTEVGYFAMILATDDLPSDNYDISKASKDN